LLKDNDLPVSVPVTRAVVRNRNETAFQPHIIVISVTNFHIIIEELGYNNV